MNGFENVLDIVGTNPICDVTCAIADKLIIGSNQKAGIVVLSLALKAWLSAKKTISKRPFSAIWAKCW